MDDRIEIQVIGDDDRSIAIYLSSESDTDQDEHGNNIVLHVSLYDGNEVIDVDSVTVYVSSESDEDLERKL